MIVGEGTVFLLLLLLGLHKIREAFFKEKKLIEQQKNFFLSISHELKTPIAATKLQLQTLQKHNLERVQQIQLLDSALLENERLNSLIDNVLLAHALDSGVHSINLTQINLSETCHNVCKRYYSKLIENNNLLVHVIEDTKVVADELSLVSIITNLIDNAIKYSNDVPKIELNVSKLNNKVNLEIKDKGVGISEENKQKIFEKFYRIGSEETRKTKGTGLGLFIVDFLVKQNNASISVKDNSPKGTIFSITFNEI